MIEVIWTRAAADDLQKILESAANPKGESKLAIRVEAAERVIATFPRSSRFNSKTQAYEAVVRGVPLLLIYEIVKSLELGERAEIIAVFYTTRDPLSKPKRRKN